MMATLTPEERAYHDALADAVDMGIYGEDALKYADHTRGTLWFQARALHHAGADLGAVIADTSPARLIRHLVAVLTRH